MGHRFGLWGGLGGGVHYFHIEGRAPAFIGSGAAAVILVSHSGGHFSPAFSGSLGATFALGHKLALFLEGRVFYLTRIPVGLVDGVAVGQTGAPGLSLATGVEFRL